MSKENSVLLEGAPTTQIRNKEDIKNNNDVIVIDYDKFRQIRSS